MKLTTIIKTSIISAVTAATVLLPATAAAITPGSVPYSGDQTAGANFPAFNIFFNVPSVGNEADFIRVKKDGEANSTLRNSVNTTCKTGDRFDVWFYVHNGAKPSLNNNGTGPGVAKNVVAKVGLPSGQRSTFPISGGVTASNADAINDGASISCGGKQFTMKYVDNSAQAFLDQPNKTVPLPKAIVEGGTPIGTDLLNGSVWGCWEQRVWMQLKVEVKEAPKEQIPPVCEELTVTKLGGRKVSVDVDFKAGDATVNNISLDFGDGNAAQLVKPNEFPFEYTYNRDGTFPIKATVLTNMGNKTSDECQKSVTVTTKTPPSIPEKPVTLVKTGAGSMAGIFVGTSVLGTLLHRKWSLRKNR